MECGFQCFSNIFSFSQSPRAKETLSRLLYIRHADSMNAPTGWTHRRDGQPLTLRITALGGQTWQAAPVKDFCLKEGVSDVEAAAHHTFALTSITDSVIS